MIEPSTPHDPIDLNAILARIDRDLAKNAKLLAEARNHHRHLDGWYAPVVVIGMILTAIAARLPEILHAFGVGQ